MAFVNRADRKLFDQLDSSLGPGSYISPTSYSQNPSFAPFSSTSQKTLFKNPLTITPGPGTYTLSHMVPQQTDQWGYKKFSSSFASQNSRFPLKQITPSPGPGSYMPNSGFKMKKNVKKIMSSQSSLLRIPSAPSIPANHQTFGYDETTTGELILQKNPEVVYSGTKIDSVGPGHYSSSIEKKKLQGPSWHKSKSKREFNNTNSTGPDLGPGCYSETNTSIGPLYKHRQNAVFLSKFKEELLQVQDKNPLGPGSYEVNKTGKKPKSSKFQNFGSTSLRFSYKPFENDIGPGHYSQNLNKTVNESKIPFLSSNTRFQYRTSNTPGPGSYKQKELSEDLYKKMWGKQGVFGSSEKRFVNKKNSFTPGPGHYRAESLKDAGEPKYKKEKMSAVFVSKDCRGKSNESFAPPPGSYETKPGFGIVKKKAVSMHPALSKVSKSKSFGQLGFDSGSVRFTSKFSTKKPPLPGPGSYNIRLPKSHNKIILSKEQRFKQSKVSGPDPGYYKQEDDWNKKSYNVLFSDTS